MKNLLEEAEKRFPVGTKFRPVSSTVTSTITTGMFISNGKGGINEVDREGKMTRTVGSRFFNCIYYNGIWAEIIN